MTMRGALALRLRPLLREVDLCGEAFVRGEALTLAAAVKEDAGDDEHSRHRQHVCECRRGCPLGGFLHAGFLPKPGRDSSWRGNAHVRQNLTRNTPRRAFALLSPHAATSTVSRSNSIAAAI